MKKIIVLLLSIVSSPIIAQVDKMEQLQIKLTNEDSNALDTVKPRDTATLNVYQDSKIDLLIQDYAEQKKTIGYRIQLFSGNSRWEAVQVKSDFLAKFKEAKPPYLVYQQPNFKIRVGNHRNRLEATKFLKLYKVEFPSAFIVKDEIEVDLDEQSAK